MKLQWCLALRGLVVALCVLALASCSDNDDSDGPIEQYSQTRSPDGEVIASVYHHDSPNGGLTQVYLDFVGVGFGCGAGSAAWYEYDIGVELRWIDAEVLEVTYPEGKSYEHNPSGDFLGCAGRGVRVVMVPRRNASLSGGAYSRPVEMGHAPSPDGKIAAYTVRYDSPAGGIAQVVLDFPETPGCADSAVTFYDHEIDLQFDWIDTSTIEIRYPDDRRFDLPPWGTSVRCVTETAEVRMQPVRDASDEFEILVWTSDTFSEEDLYPAGDIVEGPCGPMRILKASNLRELTRDQYKSLERVLEFSEDGTVIGEWRIPVESSIYDIEDNWLTAVTSDGYLSINQQGEMRRTDRTGPRQDKEYLGECSEPVLTEFLGPNGESDYLACYAINDRASGETRRLAYQGVCT